MKFGIALEALKEGKKVCRSGWNKEEMYLWMLAPAVIKKDWIKDESLLTIIGEADEISMSGFIRMCLADKTILTGWTPNTLDMLAEDWIIIN